MQITKRNSLISAVDSCHVRHFTWRKLLLSLCMYKISSWWSWLPSMNWCGPSMRDWGSMNRHMFNNFDWLWIWNSNMFLNMNWVWDWLLNCKERRNQISLLVNALFIVNWIRQMQMGLTWIDMNVQCSHVLLFRFISSLPKIQSRFRE